MSQFLLLCLGAFIVFKAYSNPKEFEEYIKGLYQGVKALFWLTVLLLVIGLFIYYIYAIKTKIINFEWWHLLIIFILAVAIEYFEINKA